MRYSPVCLLTFNRPNHTFKTLRSLSANNEAIETDLFVFIDGPRKNSEIHLIDSVEIIVNSYKSKFKSINIKRSDVNLSLGSSVYRALNFVFENSETVISLEDDVIVSKYFLSYMNRALDFYKNQKDVWHINSYNFPINYKADFECFFSKQMMSFGFGTWKDKWLKFINDPLARDPHYLIDIFNNEMIKELDLNLNRSIYWYQVENNANGKFNNTWAIFWFCYIFLQKGLCLTPKISLSRNIGHDGSGVHTGYNKELLLQKINENLITEFPLKIEENKYCKSLLRLYYSRQNSIIARFLRKSKIILKRINNIYKTGL